MLGAAVAAEAGTSASTAARPWKRAASATAIGLVAGMAYSFGGVGAFTVRTETVEPVARSVSVT